MTNLCIHNTDPNQVWVTFSGYNAADKVFYTSNGGSTWTAMTTLGLPNLPVNCVTYQTGSNGALYIGTDVGVYYKDNTMSAWQNFSTGLPNVIVNELMIFTGAPNRLRAATYGRGFWESDLYTVGSGTPPTAAFTATPHSGCPTLSVTYTDASTNNPTAILWTFPGGTPGTSSSLTQTVTYSTPGNYDVTLVAANAYGTDTLTMTNYVDVFDKPVPTVTKTNITCHGANNGIASVSITGGVTPYTIAWSNGANNVSSINGLAPGSYTVTVTDNNGCTNSSTFTINQPTAIVPVSGSGNGTAWVTTSGGQPPYSYYWSDPMHQTTDTAFNLSSGTYVVIITDSHGCSVNDTITVIKITGIDASGFGQRISIFPNPVRQILTIACADPLSAEITVTDLLGRNLIVVQMDGETQRKLDVSALPSGDYLVKIKAGTHWLTAKINKL